MKSILSRVWDTGDIYKAKYEGERCPGTLSACPAFMVLLLAGTGPAADVRAACKGKGDHLCAQWEVSRHTCMK